MRTVIWCACLFLVGCAPLSLEKEWEGMKQDVGAYGSFIPVHKFIRGDEPFKKEVKYENEDQHF